MDELTLKRTIKKIKKGDEDAFLGLIDTYSALLKTIIGQVLGAYPSDKEEVLNDVFLKIWDNIAYFDPKMGTFENWICAIAKYQAIDRLRGIYLKENIELREDLLAQGPTPEEKILENELYKEILDLLDTLKDTDKKIFLDLFFKGLTYEEVSLKYGIKISNLYNIVSRSRKSLKKTYEEERK